MAFENRKASDSNPFTTIEEVWVQTGATGITLIKEGTAPSAVTGYGQVYVKSSDHKLYFLNNTGTEFDLTTAGTDEKVKYNVSDTVAGYLSDKTVAGTGISLAEGTGGNVDKLEITNSAPFVDAASDGSTYGRKNGAWSAIGAGAGDMILADTQSVTGLKTFDKDKLAMKGTSTGVTVISTANTSATSYTAILQAADGTVAYMTDIPAVTGFATKALDNLASVAINTTLVSDTDNTDALGTTAIAWSDLFLGNGAVVSFNSAPSTPDVTITHSSNLLTLAGGDFALGANNITITGSIGATGAGKALKVWAIDAEFTNLPTINGGTLATALSLSSYAPVASPSFTTQITTPKVLASSNDSGALGASGTAFSDLFLASGGVINWSAGNATITHSTGLLTINVPVDLGTSNAIKVGSIELGHATDSSITRVSAGVIAIEGIPIVAAGSTTVGQVPTITGSNTYSWQTPSAGGAFWTAVAGSPTRASNTTFTVTGDYSTLFLKGMVLKWTESAAVKNAMVSIPSTYSSPNTTVTIIGDTMASIDASSLKYAMVGVIPFATKFPVAGTIGAVLTDVSNAFYATQPKRVLGADLQVGTAGTTNSTTIDINKNGTTMFTTKPTLATTVAASPLPFTADSGTSLALNDKVTIDIDAIQTTAAIDLYVQLYLWPLIYNNFT